MHSKIIKDAKFSSCRRYRYALWRIWDKSKARALFIGLNPSTGDEIKDDPTIMRCIKFAKSWDCGGVYLTNLFAYRSSSPREMMIFRNPIGNENDKWIKKLSEKSTIIIAAWGNQGIHLNRSRIIEDKIPNLKYLKKNKSGQPSHPLYLKSNLKPKPLKEKHMKK